MLDSLLLRGMTAAALAAAVTAFGFWMDAQAKADKIETLQTQLNAANANTAALDVIAAAVPRLERRSRDALAAINAAGERTSDACLNDPRVRAYYDGFRMRDAERHNAP